MAAGLGSALPPVAKPTMRIEPDACEEISDRIGHYKILQQLGEGGCGVVYMAEQTEPVRRRVALKVIKLGMDTREVIARFEAERQALAMMDHPNIAKVLDAGTTEKGRPYFVMELVKGIRITDYCDQNHLSTRERLGLFTQVCQAIQHAHQKGIIHRDIKPSNILVTLHDGVPVPKVIDFGIAKATEQPLTEKTVFTAFGQFMGTPAYMSPEQAELSGLDIDTRSDIYALGVLLYELLTGKTPFDAKELLQAGLDEMRRRIREEEPLRPSTRLSTMANADLTTIAQQRQAEPGKLTRFIRGDLDWIVMKCLEKDRRRRYETANGLAMDVLRHLNHEPVVAARPSALYTFQKFSRRHRVALATTTAFVFLLMVGVIVSTSQAIRASRAEKAAKAQAGFLKSILEGITPQVARGRDTTVLSTVLSNAAARVGRELANQPDVEADMRLTIGATYLSMGEYTNALAMTQEALRLAKAHSKRRTVAGALNNLGVIYSELGDLTNAIAYDRQALELKKELLGPEHPDVATSMSNLGFRHWNLNRYVEAEELLRESLRIRRKVLTNNHPDIGKSLNNLAMARWALGHFDEGESLFRQALAVFEANPDGDQTLVATMLNNVGTVLRDVGLLDEAEAMKRKALAMRQKLLGSRNSYVPYSQTQLAIVLQKQGKLDEAESLHRESLPLLRELLVTNHQFVAESLGALALVLACKGEAAEAEVMQLESLATAERALGKDNPDSVDSLNQLANLRVARGDLPGAESMLTNALAITKKLVGDDHPDLIQSLSHLSRVLKQKGDLPAAEALRREATRLSQKGGNYGVRALTDSTYDLADTLQAQGKFTEAEPLLTEAWEYLQGQPGAYPDFKRNSLERLARFYEAWDRAAPKTGKADLAAIWREKLKALPAPTDPATSGQPR